MLNRIRRYFGTVRRRLTYIFHYNTFRLRYFSLRYKLIYWLARGDCIILNARIEGVGVYPLNSVRRALMRNCVIESSTENRSAAHSDMFQLFHTKH